MRVPRKHEPPKTRPGSKKPKAKSYQILCPNSPLQWGTISLCCAFFSRLEESNCWQYVPNYAPFLRCFEKCHSLVKATQKKRLKWQKPCISKAEHGLPWSHRKAKYQHRVHGHSRCMGLIFVIGHPLWLSSLGDSFPKHSIWGGGQIFAIFTNPTGF